VSNDFDPFRKHQDFNPKPIQNDLPHLGILEYEQSIKSNVNFYTWKVLLWTASIMSLLLLSIWSQLDTNYRIVIHRSALK
jgi:hypothetical protein